MNLRYLNGELECCALAQLSANNDTTVQEIERFLAIAKEDRDCYDEIEETSETNITCGERGFFCIVAAEEENLEANLITCGFTKIAEFKRKKCYEQETNLKMYFINI